MEVRVMFEHDMYGKYMRWSFSWLGQKVYIAIAGVALTGGGDFGPRRILPRYFSLVILVTGLSRKIYLVLSSNGLAFSLRVCYYRICHQRDANPYENIPW